MALLSSARRPSREDGYVLITMLLVVSLMTIAALAVLPSITFQIKREREKEMIHRGVQYSRAIRTYYKKFGRYPTKLEDLDNTNNLRYLRKHYKDPITGQDFRLLHFGEPGLTLGGSFGGGTIPGANPIGGAGANGAAGSNSAFGGSGFGNTGNSGFGNASNSGFGNTGVNNSGVFSQSSSFGGNASGGNANGGSSSSGFGANSNSQSGAAQPGTTAAPGSDSTQASTQVAAGTAQGETSSSGQQLIASGPIVGVASVSKKTTIREFNHKKKYNEWQFVYDPTLDRGGLITTPYQPALQSFGGQAGQNMNMQPGSSSGGLNGTSSGSSFGNSFGQQPGMSNSPNSPGGLTPPPQPPSTPPQQQ